MKRAVGSTSSKRSARKNAVPPPPAAPPPQYESEIPPRSVSEDDDDDDACTSTEPVDAHEALVEDVMENKRSDAMAYLLRYETMVRQQEAEDMAVLAHIRPCVQRLLQLAGSNLQEQDDDQFLSREVSFSTLKRACMVLEELQENSRLTEHMTTDRQLMMVLRLLTQKTAVGNGNDAENTATITWAEIIQCYKVCIAGMLTLQHLPNESGAVRARARDRTLAMLSLFEPPSTFLFHEDAVATLGTRAVVDSRPLTATLGGVANVSRASASMPLTKHSRSSNKLRKKKARRVLVVIAAVVMMIAFVMAFKWDSFTSVPLDAEIGLQKATSTPLQRKSATLTITGPSPEPAVIVPNAIQDATRDAPKPNKPAAKKLEVKSVLQDSLWMIL